MPTIDIKSNIDKFDRIYQVRERQLPSIVRMTINKVGPKVVTASDSYIRKKVAVKKKDVMKRIRPLRARIDRLEFSVFALKKPFSVISFPSVRWHKKGEGVTYKRTPSGKRGLKKHAFIRRVKGKRQVLRRKSIADKNKPVYPMVGRTPLVVQKDNSVARLVQAKSFDRMVEAKVEKELPTELERAFKKVWTQNINI